jgi:hypothetical protein
LNDPRPAASKISARPGTRYIVMAEVGYMRREYCDTGTEVPSAAGNVKRMETNESCENFTGPLIIRKRIGTTNYEVSAYFSRTSTESVEDKILRLALNDTLNGEANP